MASLINAGFVLLTMLFLASLFKDLPDAVLGAVVIDAMIGLMNFGLLVRYFRVNPVDWVFYMACFIGLIFSGIIPGIVIGVVLSLLLLVARASRPALRRLGRDPDNDTYVDTARRDGLIVEPEVLVIRLDGPLFFANANRFHDGVIELVSSSDTPVKAVVADMEAVSQTDTDGADILTAMAQEMRVKHVWFGIARAEEDIVAMWERAGAVDAIGRDHVFEFVRAAVDAAKADAGRPASAPIASGARG